MVAPLPLMYWLPLRIVIQHCRFFGGPPSGCVSVAVHILGTRLNSLSSRWRSFAFSSGDIRFTSLAAFLTSCSVVIAVRTFRFAALLIAPPFDGTLQCLSNFCG